MITKVSEIIEKSGRDHCFIFCSGIWNQPSSFRSSVFSPSNLSLRYFTSNKNVEDTKSQAIKWIQRKLFKEFSEKFIREVNTSSNS